MKITICGSIAFYDEMLEIKKKLEQLGHQIKFPPNEIMNEKGDMIHVKEYYDIRKSTSTKEGWIWDRKEEAMRLHFQKIEWSDAVLILNYEKNNIPDYIGANTLLEMGLAFHLGKKIYLLNQIPDITYSEEILGMKPNIINGNLNLIN